MLIILGVMWLNSLTKAPFLCAGIFAAIQFIFKWLTGTPIPTAFISGLIGLVISAGVFFTINKLEGYGLVKWVAIVIGFFVLFYAG